MPNPNCAHVAPRFPSYLVDHIAKRQQRENLKTFSAAARLELIEALEAGGPYGAAPATTELAIRKELWLPRDVVQQVRNIAEASAATTSTTMIAILASRLQTQLAA